MHVETVVMLSHKKPDSVINVKVEFGEGEGKVPLDNIAKRAEAYKPKERVNPELYSILIEDIKKDSTETEINSLWTKNFGKTDALPAS